jgi:hypothetical protein
MIGDATTSEVVDLAGREFDEALSHLEVDDPGYG